MPKWSEYTSKDTLADNDEVMLYDATARANKRGLMSKFWDYVVDKMATAVISKLQTNNKTIIGAINALNSDSFPRVTISSSSDTIENVIDTQKTDFPMLIYGTTGAGEKQNLPAQGVIWAGIAISAVDRVTVSLYLFGNNHIYAKTKSNNKWGGYVVIA